jgi:hypothetical protein
MLQDLGFIINQEKSVFKPSKCLVHLGTVLDFTAGTVTPTLERIQNLQAHVEEIKSRPRTAHH